MGSSRRRATAGSSGAASPISAVTAGGKWTTYRAMAEDVLDRAMARTTAWADRCLAVARPPGQALFEVLTSHPDTRQVRFIAEDLGVITPDVELLRDRFAFPGIRVLQFGFGDDDFYDGRPWAFRKNLVAYTSTHDNATIVGWYRGETDGTRTAAQAARERDKVNDYMGHNPSPDYVHFALIRLAMSTVADTVIVPVQDVLGLGNVARMNTPGIPEGNWKFRLLPGQLDDGRIEHLRHVTKLYGRIPKASGKV